MRSESGSSGSGHARAPRASSPPRRAGLGRVLAPPLRRPVTQGHQHGRVVVHRLEGHDPADGVVLDHDLVAHRVDERAPGLQVHIGDQGQPPRGQPRAQQGHRQDEQVPALDVGDPGQHLQVAQHVGPAHLEGAALGLGCLQHAHEVPDDVGDRDRLGPGVHPARGDHRRQVRDQLAGHLPGHPAVPDDDAGPQHGHRDPALAQQPLHLAAAAEVVGQVVGVLPETAQVDDPAHPGVGGRPAERAGGVRVLVHEVGVPEAVHQVVGGVAALQGRAQRGLVLHVPGHRVTGSGVGLRTAGHRLDPVPFLHQGRRQPTTHEPGRPSHQNLHLTSVRVAGRARSPECDELVRSGSRCRPPEDPRRVHSTATRSTAAGRGHPQVCPPRVEGADRPTGR